MFKKKLHLFLISSDDLFEREVLGETNFISIYYLEYGDPDEEDMKKLQVYC